MTEHSHDQMSRDDRLAEVLGNYLEAYRAGNAPSKEELLRQHPELAADLSGCLASLEFVQLAGVQTSPHNRLTEDDTPASIGDFRIVREIGRGGMGVVYEAIQASLGRRVALKVLPLAAILSDTQKARFRNEAQAVGLLVHENIVPIYQVGDDRGVHYYAMQYVDGRTLADVIDELRRARESKSPPDTAVPACDHSTVRISGQDQDTDTRHGKQKTSPAIFAPSGNVPIHRNSEFFRGVARIGVQAASALQHAHEMGVVHRDIKPTNLLIDANAKVWVADFGLAHIESDAAITCTGDILGTARYMSPEQATGLPLLDHRTDIFSLAMTLYELVTLNHVSPGDDRLQIIRDICDEEPKAPRLHNDRIPSELETIILKALEKNPADRYQSAAELQADLQRFLDDMPILARRPTLLQRARKWTHRNRAVATTVVVSLFLLLATITTVSLVALNRLARSEQLSLERLYESHLHRADAERGTLNPNRRSDSLASVREAAALMHRLGLDKDRQQVLRVRNEMISSLSIPLDVRTIVDWPHPSPTWFSSFDSELSEYALFDALARQIVIKNAGNNAEVSRLPRSETSDEFDFVEVSPNGRFLVYVARDRNRAGYFVCRIWDRSMSRRIIDDVPVALAGSYVGLQFTANSDFAWIQVSDRSVHCYELPTGELRREFNLSHLGMDSVTCASISPNGKRLAVVNGQQTLKIVTLDPQTVDELPQHHSPIHAPLRWSRDGRYLAARCWDRRGYVWDVSSRQQVTLLAGSFVTGNIDFNAAATLLATHHRSGHTVIWDAMTGRELFSLPGRFSRFSSCGNQLAWNTSHRSGIWEIENSPEYRVYQAIGSNEVFTAFPVGSNLVAAGCEDGLRIWCRYSCQLMADLRSLGRTYAMYHGPSSSIVTNSASGVQLWPVRQENDGVTVGPPETLLANAAGQYFDLAQSRDGSRIIVRLNGSTRRVALYDITERKHLGELPVHNNTQFLALSPDGQFAVTGSWHGLEGQGLWIWDANTGQPRRQLFSQKGDAQGKFTPDAQRFVLSSSYGYVAYDAVNWEPLWRINRDGASDSPGPIAFSVDSKLVTVRTNEQSMKLVHVDSGETVATLEDPNQLTSITAEFSGEGSLLEPVFNRVRMWDVAAIRERLAEVGLDWEGPPTARNTAMTDAVARVTILRREQ